ncbi:hypothetical protein CAUPRSCDRAFT_12491, partial [Caulochytrium protostelioides]
MSSTYSLFEDALPRHAPGVGPTKGLGGSVASSHSNIRQLFDTSGPMLGDGTDPFLVVEPSGHATSSAAAAVTGGGASGSAAAGHGASSSGGGSGVPTTSPTIPNALPRGPHHSISPSKSVQSMMGSHPPSVYYPAMHLPGSHGMMPPGVGPFVPMMGPYGRGVTSSPSAGALHTFGGGVPPQDPWGGATAMRSASTEHLFSHTSGGATAAAFTGGSGPPPRTAAALPAPTSTAGAAMAASVAPGQPLPAASAAMGPPSHPGLHGVSLHDYDYGRGHGHGPAQGHPHGHPANMAHLHDPARSSTDVSGVSRPGSLSPEKTTSLDLFGHGPRPGMGAPGSSPVPGGSSGVAGSGMDAGSGGPLGAHFRIPNGQFRGLALSRSMPSMEEQLRD